MFHSVILRTLVASLALMTVSGALLSGPVASPASADVTPRSCGWQLAVDPALLNVLYPDEAAHYWVLALPLLPGQSLELRGRYPHSRYFSFTAYDPTLRSTDGIHDTAIAPDRGSRNPFVAGASRTVKSRSYTVRVVPGKPPAKRAANTLYAGSLALVIYRNYRQDRGLDDDGGVGLPDIVLRAGKASIPLSNCPYPAVPPNGLNALLANASLADVLPPLLGSPDPQWRKFYNLPTSVGYALTTTVTGQRVGDLLAPLTTKLPKGGFADNPDNTYIATVLSTSHGEVAVLKGRMPTFPRTFEGQKQMGSGQLRYWSMCSEEFATTRYYGCVNDDEVPLGPHRTFTLMVSTAAKRPANATSECGIAWLPAGPAPDTVMIQRNMLPAPSFTQSIQAARYGQERSDLGPYYPNTTYMTQREAEALGC